MTWRDDMQGAARSELIERLERAAERASQGMRRAVLDMIRPFELSMIQFAVLVTLRDFGRPTKISDLGDATITPASSMTHTIDRLEQRGLIERSGDLNDRRAILVSLTGAGLRVIDEIEQSHRRYFMERCSTLDDEELMLLISISEQFAASPYPE